MGTTVPEEQDYLRKSVLKKLLSQLSAAVSVGPGGLNPIHQPGGETGVQSSSSDSFTGSHGAYSNYALLRLAGQCCDEYLASDEGQKKEFILALAKSHGLPDLKGIQSSVSSYPQSVDEQNAEQAMIGLSRKLEQLLQPRYLALFRSFVHLPDGIAFLVQLREDVINLLEQSTTAEFSASSDVREQLEDQKEKNCQKVIVTAFDIVRLRFLQVHLRDILGVCFSVGLLHLTRVTWNSPCVLVEKIAEHEAVHRVRSWADLKQRVGPNRRVFVFLHPSMENDPIMILHVALMPKISVTMQDVLLRYAQPSDRKTALDAPIEDPARIKAAVLYSISSTKKGLSGIDLGHSLIERVVSQLSVELPGLSQFSSLSPMPGFREWVLDRFAAMSPSQIGRKLPEDVIKENDRFVRDDWSEFVRNVPSDWPGSPLQFLHQQLKDSSWKDKPRLAIAIRPILLRMAASYLYTEKRRGFALNSVANFHLRNGACLWRINWMGNPSTQGMQQSFGIMVNYRYYPGETDVNSTAYLTTGTIPVSNDVMKLLVD